MALKITPGNTADSTVLDEMTAILRASSTPTRSTSAANCSTTLAAWPTPHHQHSAQHEELSMPLADKIMLRKRFVIETVLDTLKSESASSIHAIGRSSTPWSMSCPASSLTRSDPVNPPFH